MKTLLYALVLIAAMYALLLRFSVGPPGGFWSGDQGVKLHQVESLVQNRFQSFALRYPGGVLDPTSRFTPFVGQYLHHEGRAYGMFPPSFIFVSAIPYSLMGDAGLTSVPVLSTLVALLLCGMITLRIFSKSAAVAVMLVLAFGSPLLFYAVVFWEHATSVAFVMAAIYLLVRWDIDPRCRGLVIAGACIGIAAWFRNEAILAAPALTLGLLAAYGIRVGVRPGLWMAAGVVSALIPFVIFNSIQVGSPLGGHAAVAGQVTYSLHAGGFDIQGIQFRVVLLEMLVAPLSAWRLLFPLLAGGAISIVAHRLRGGRRLQVATLAIGLSGVLAILLFPLETPRELPTSLLSSFPLFMFALLPPVAGRDERELRRTRIEKLLLVYSGLFIFLIIALGMPHGGAQWGPRILLPSLPPLAIVAVARACDYIAAGPKQTRAVALTALVMLAITGMAVEFYGLRQLAQSAAAVQSLNRVVGAASPGVIISNSNVAVSLLAPILHHGKLIFRPRSEPDLHELAAILRSRDLEEVYLITAASESFGHESLARIARSKGSPMALPFALEGRVFDIRKEPDLLRTVPGGPRVLEGVLDVVDCDRIQGWARDAGRSESAILVNVLANGRSILLVEASELRPDLATAGKGTGRHAFTLETPAILKDGLRYEIEARVSETDFALTRSPRSLICPPLGPD